MKTMTKVQAIRRLAVWSLVAAVSGLSLAQSGCNSDGSRSPGSAGRPRDVYSPNAYPFDDGYARFHRDHAGRERDGYDSSADNAHDAASAGRGAAAVRGDRAADGGRSVEHGGAAQPAASRTPAGASEGKAAPAAGRGESGAGVGPGAHAGSGGAGAARGGGGGHGK
jgi:hypothetical protein